MSYKTYTTYLAIAIAVFAFFAMANSASAGIIAKPPNNLGLVGYWPMEEGTGTQAGDFSGNGNHGTLTLMDPSTDWVNGKRGGALDFDGSDDKVNAGDPASLRVENNNGATWTAWIHPRNAGNSSSFQEVIFDKEAGSNGGVFLYLQSNTLIFYNGSAQTGSTVINNNEWYFVTVVKDGSNGETFVDGISDNTFSWAATPDSTGTDFIIGGDACCARAFTGLIDEVRVYNRALTAAEVDALYRSGRVTGTINNTGLVGYWPMNEGRGAEAGDFSGQANHGTLTNMDPSTDWVPGKRGKALDFDGGNDFVDISYSALDFPSATSEITLSAWVKTSTVGDASIFGFRDSGSGSPVMDFQIGNDGIDNDNTGFVSFIVRDDGSVGLTHFHSSTDLRDGNWHHVVATIDSSKNMKIYVDGIQDGSGTHTMTAGITTDTKRIGDESINGNIDEMDGQIDEVRIYNRALTAAEVSALYQATAIKHARTDNRGLVGYWPMNEGRGAEAGDFSGQANHGTLTNMDPSTDWVNGKRGGALDFNESGTNDEVVIATGFPALASGDSATISGWIKNRRTSGIGSIFGFGAGGDNPILALNIANENIGGWIETDTSGQKTLTADGTKLIIGEWSHVVAVFDRTNNQAIRYLNGVQTGTIDDISAQTGQISTLGVIGIGDFTSGNYVNGTIDEVRVYNRALSAAEVSSLYNLGR